MTVEDSDLARRGVDIGSGALVSGALSYAWTHIAHCQREGGITVCYNVFGALPTPMPDLAAAGFGGVVGGAIGYGLSKLLRG